MTDEANMFGAYSTREKADAANPHELQWAAYSYETPEQRKERGIVDKWKPKYEVHEVEVDEVPLKELRLV